MTDKITLGSIASFQNDATAVTQYNANNALITTALNNTLSRDGTSPNQLNAALDLNGNAILNGTVAGLSAANIPFVPTGNVSSTNVQTAIAELDTKKAAISNISNVGFSGAAVDLVSNLVTWTPTLTFATPGDVNVVYTARLGYYKQLTSNLVLVHIDIITSTFTFTTASGNLQVTGLPFTTSNTAGLTPRGALSFSGINKTGFSQVAMGIALNSSTFIFNASGMNVSSSAVGSADMTTGTNVTLIGNVIIHI